MARVTVEDCVDKVPNRFDLALFAAHRARLISGGEQLTVERDRDKNPVVALREIAEQTVDPMRLEKSLTASMQKLVAEDDDTPDDLNSIIGAREAFQMNENEQPAAHVVGNHPVFHPPL